MGGLIHLRNPKETVDQVLERLLKIKEKAQKVTEDVLEKEGCDSVEGQNTAKALKLYTGVQPWNMLALIDGEITKQGGTITSNETINAVPPPEEKE